MSDLPAPISPGAAAAGTDADPFLVAHDPGPNATPQQRQQYEQFAAEYKSRVAALHARHGLPTPPPAPLTREAAALAAHDEATEKFLGEFVNGADGTPRTSPMSGVASVIESELARVEALDQDGRHNAAAAVKARLGDQYDTMVAAAKLVAEGEWSDAMLASEYTLRTMAAIAKYRSQISGQRAQLVNVELQSRRKQP